MTYFLCISGFLPVTISFNAAAWTGAGTGGGAGGERRPNNISAKVQTSPPAAFLGPNSLLARGVYLNKMKPLSASRSRRGGRMSSNSSVDLEIYTPGKKRIRT